MMGIYDNKAANAERALRMASELPTITSETPDKFVAAQLKLAMNRFDEWLANVERALVGRQVVRTRGPNMGSTATITDVCVASGASGKHVFILAPVAYEVLNDVAEPASFWRERVQDSEKLLEIGVSCELLARDDVPA